MPTSPTCCWAGSPTGWTSHAETFRPSSEAFVNPAKALALELAGTVPVVLGDGDVTGVAADAAPSSMLARTARVPAMRGALPDDAGDVVATFGGPFAATAARPLRRPLPRRAHAGSGCACCFLRDADAQPWTARTAPGWRHRAPPTPSG